MAIDRDIDTDIDGGTKIDMEIWRYRDTEIQGCRGIDIEGDTDTEDN